MQKIRRRELHILISVLKHYLNQETNILPCWFVTTMQSALLISEDNAHAVHPNYPEKHEGNHLPLLNAGPVIKINSNQRYATSSETAAKFLFSAEELDVPVQKFVYRSDMGCGSTIGPITAKELGIRTLDIGLQAFIQGMGIRRDEIQDCL